MTGALRWTTPADIAERVRRRWVDGSLLRAAVGGEFVPIEVPLKGPTASDLGDHVDQARRWSADLIRSSRDGAHFSIAFGEIGGRHIGRTRVPVRAVLNEPQQAWALLGVHQEVARFAEQFTQSPEQGREWMLRHPHQALAAGADWAGILAAFDWISSERGRGRFLREVTAGGVDTKLIERHRGVLAGFFGVPAGADAFATTLGFAVRPATVRMRFDPEVFGFPEGFTEAVFRLDELDRVQASVDRALIIENEATYLAAPVPENGVVLWGKGYDASNPASLRWLKDVPVTYWGDIDTHGFAILNRVRSRLPQARSVLMDLDTLLTHRARWGAEAKPTNVALGHLEAADADVYAVLVTDRHGQRVRLEQERVDWAWAIERLARAHTS
ncbi:Wadjet anti-phage system protein JetD domain-containing protein [Microbacterium sp. SD291]|uniref:Wadjet anti-phage system protein JetD domain-containing protein n=1 Tax=Microbacterium sp. SD291 TaxID=2782007 RepID=UPI001A97ADD2|nr:Wadjet anti-phage system protein JetD domain-containing protein [Microbacterium sp. SD291]MBO0981808.1 hypothetical protein [Microbacterium sp. SD291]